MKIINLILLFSLLSACGQKPASVKKYYRLSLNQQTVSEQISDNELWIKRPEAHSILGNRPMVASDDSGALQQLIHHAWIESPKVLLQEMLQLHFQNAWSSVQIERPRSDNYFQLHSRILAFEKQQNQAYIKITFSFYSPEMELIKQVTLSKLQPLSGPGYTEFAHGMSAAINEILAQLELKA